MGGGVIFICKGSLVVKLIMNLKFYLFDFYVCDSEGNVNLDCSVVLLIGCGFLNF